MPGLVPGIHVLALGRKAWMAGSSPAMTGSEEIYRGTTAVASISTSAAFSTRRTTCTNAIAG
jgi:hypothetical protein